MANKSRIGTFKGLAAGVMLAAAAIGLSAGCSMVEDYVNAPKFVDASTFTVKERSGTIDPSYNILTGETGRQRGTVTTKFVNNVKGTVVFDERKHRIGVVENIPGTLGYALRVRDQNGVVTNEIYHQAKDIDMGFGGFTTQIQDTQDKVLGVLDINPAENWNRGNWNLFEIKSPETGAVVAKISYTSASPDTYVVNILDRARISNTTAVGVVSLLDQIEDELSGDFKADYYARNSKYYERDSLHHGNDPNWYLWFFYWNTLGWDNYTTYEEWYGGTYTDDPITDSVMDYVYDEGYNDAWEDFNNSGQGDIGDFLADEGYVRDYSGYLRSTDPLETLDETLGDTTMNDYSAPIRDSYTTTSTPFESLDDTLDGTEWDQYSTPTNTSVFEDESQYNDNIWDEVDTRQYQDSDSSIDYETYDPWADVDTNQNQDSDTGYETYDPWADSDDGDSGWFNDSSSDSSSDDGGWSDSGWNDSSSDYGGYDGD